MILGVSYNIFDGEEVLEGCIKQIREQVDFISVVYQTKSNFGNPADANLVPLLEDLKSRGLVDKLYLYEPTTIEGFNNEVTKRNIGLDLSRKANCTHHMSMDSDEYYTLEEFKYMKEQIEEKDADAAYCKMQTYYKTWEYALDPPEEYYVATIYKIKENAKFVFQYPCTVLVDPTRRMSKVNNPLVFTRENVQMHHGSYIRNDVRSKLENSSSKGAFANDIERIVDHYNKWEYPNKVLWGSFPTKELTVVKVKNLFNE